MTKIQDNSRSPLLSQPERKTSRSCNDILFAIAFLAMFAGMIVISSVAFAKGNPHLLVPSNSPEYIKQYGEGSAQAWMQNAVAQLKTDVGDLAGAVGIAVLVGIIWIQLLRSFTKLFIYLTLILGVLAVLGLGGYFLGLGVKDSKSSLHIVGYCLFGLAALLALVIVFLRSKIALTSAMFTETCKGVQHSHSLFITVLITLVLFIGFTSYWTASFVYLYSVPDHSINITNTTMAAGLPSSIHPPQFNESIRNLMYFMVFGFFWTAAFLSATFQHSVAGAISSWYFSRGAAGMGKVNNGIGSPAVVSFLRGFTTSFGSLAFGSLLLAIVEFMSFLLQLSKRANARNRFAVFVISCIQCVLGCIEALTKFVNKYAYVHVAMHGYGFCKAARECYDLVSRNMFDAVIMDMIGGFVLFMGKVLFTAVTLMITLAINPHLGSISIALVSVVSFVILHIISHIIGVGVNTVFICYLEDLEMNKDGNLYMSPEVHAMLQDKAKVRQAERV